MINSDVSDFIRASFTSVWALEVLLFLKRSQGVVTDEAVVGELRASESAVEQALASLFAAGLVLREGKSARYNPSSPRLADLVEQTEQLYDKKPDTIRRLIVLGRSSSLAAFSDAFSLRRN